MVTLRNWTTSDFSTYTAPECRAFILAGDAVAHPTLGDAWITTSNIAHVNGRVITTKSGSVYKLGRVGAKAKALLKAHDMAYNPTNPLACLVAGHGGNAAFTLGVR